MKKLIKFLGIDVGGAHIKIVGLDKNGIICYVAYKNCPLWKNIKNLKNQIKFINKLSKNKDITCGITMTGELCDLFKDRISGAKIIFEECLNIHFKKLFYTNSDKAFKKKNLNFEEVISMNWHATGRFLEKILDNAVIVDFGSTTTDFICIKKNKLVNKGLDDFSRINNSELLYTGLTRTPIFGILNTLIYKKKKYQIIPEFFSNMSDVYRIKKKIIKNFDLDEVADKTGKSTNASLRRISRSFGFDYNNEKKKLLKSLVEILSKEQLNKISNNIDILFKKFKFKKSTPIILCGIGQHVIYDFLKTKNKIYLLKDFFPGKNTNLKKISTYHAPALCIANLLKSKN